MKELERKNAALEQLLEKFHNNEPLTQDQLSSLMILFRKHKGLSAYRKFINSESNKKKMKLILGGDIENDKKVQKAIEEAEKATHSNNRIKKVSFIAILLLSITLLVCLHKKPVKFVTEKRYDTYVTLQDSSRVLVKAGSEMYPTNYREATIKGKAFFDITKDPTTPFRVITRDSIIIIVLGTSFSVECDSTSTEIDVQSGKVKVQKGNKTLAVLNAKKGMRITPELYFCSFPIEDTAFNWLDEDLVFTNTKLRDIAAVLERRFGVQIQFKYHEKADEIVNARLTGQTSFREVLNQLKELEHFDYTFQNNTYFIH